MVSIEIRNKPMNHRRRRIALIGGAALSNRGGVAVQMSGLILFFASVRCEWRRSRSKQPYSPRQVWQHFCSLPLESPAGPWLLCGVVLKSSQGEETMKTTRAFLAIGFSLSVSLTSTLAQETYPKRSVQIVNPYPAGSTTDLLARALAEGLTTRLGQQFVILNRPGAGGALGTASVVRGDADGYALLFAPALVVSLLPMLRNDCRL